MFLVTVQSSPLGKNMPMLLTELLNVCVQSKSTYKNNAQMSPWYLDDSHHQYFEYIKQYIAHEVMYAYSMCPLKSILILVNF